MGAKTSKRYPCLKCTERHQDKSKHFTVKSTLYTLNAHPRGPNFTTFRSTISRFRDTSLSKIGNAPNDPRITLSTWTVKSTLYTLYRPTHPVPQIALLFALQTAVFETQACRKSEMHRMTPELLNYLTVKSTLNTLNPHPRGPNSTPFRSTLARFQIIEVFGFSIGYIGEFQKKKKKKNLANRKLKISKI